jgi:hypothetical protein
MRALFFLLKITTAAAGVGLLTAAANLPPPPPPRDPTELERSIGYEPALDHERAEHRRMLFRGAGAGLLAFGALGIVVPWGDHLFRRPRVAPLDDALPVKM